jgi:hypothetical protein
MYHHGEDIVSTKQTMGWLSSIAIQTAPAVAKRATAFVDVVCHP